MHFDKLLKKGSFHHRQLEWAYICLIKKYWNFCNIEYQKKRHSRTLFFIIPHLPISVDYQILARLKIDWTCQILNLSSFLPTYFFIIYEMHIHFRGFELLYTLFLCHQGNSATWVFTFFHLLTLCASFWRFIRAVWFDFFYFHLFPTVLGWNSKCLGGIYY